MFAAGRQSQWLRTLQDSLENTLCSNPSGQFVRTDRNEDRGRSVSQGPESEPAANRRYPRVAAANTLWPQNLPPATSNVRAKSVRRDGHVAGRAVRKTNRSPVASGRRVPLATIGALVMASFLFVVSDPARILATTLAAGSGWFGTVAVCDQAVEAMKRAMGNTY